MSEGTKLVLINLKLVGGELDGQGTTYNEERGGSVLLEKNSRLIAKRVKFVGNKAHRGGFAVYLGTNAIFNCTNCVFSGNKFRSTAVAQKNSFGTIGGTDVGGLYLRNCLFSGNLAWNEQGGAIGVKFYRGEFGSQPRDNLGIVLENCTFHKNSARTGGAVFFAHASTAIIRSCIFDNNIASSGDGGSLFIDNGVSHGSLFCIERTVFENNSALQGNGGAVAMTRASELLYLSTYTPVNSKYEPMLVDDCYFKKFCWFFRWSHINDLSRL